MGRIARALEQYDEFRSKAEAKKRKGPTPGEFYSNDWEEIMEMSGGDKFWIADAALHAGFIIGYNCAKREARQP